MEKEPRPELAIAEVLQDRPTSGDTLCPFFTDTVNKLENMSSVIPTPFQEAYRVKISYVTKKTL